MEVRALRLTLPLTFALALGCVHESTVVPFPQADHLVLAPSKPEQVGIYRSTRPFANFQELGLISFHTNQIELTAIYQQLRIDAAKHGADAIVDLKIKGETHTETKTVQKCTPETVCDAAGTCATHDVCHDETVNEQVSNYRIEGSMIRRIQ